MWLGLRSTSIPSGIFIHPAVVHNKHDEKVVGGAVPLFQGEMDPHLTMSPGPRSASLPSVILIHPAIPAIWSQQTWAEKWWRCCAPLFVGGELGPHLIQCGRSRGLPECQVSSLSVQPFGHSTPTSHDRTGQDIQDRQRPDSIGRTVLQTVAEKKTVVSN